MSRRSALAGLATLAAPLVILILAPAFSQRRTRSFRTLQNTSVSGSQAWFYLAQDKGHLAAEGIDCA